MKMSLFSILLEKYLDHIFAELVSEDRDVFFFSKRDLPLTLIVNYFKNKQQSQLILQTQCRARLDTICCHRLKRSLYLL